MVIKNNLEALNTFNYLEKNRSDLAKSLEKLSSGLRINRAADDAAGLGISEKMRAQIIGLQTALANSKNGISLVQVAEGALSEVHSMLNRMKELAVQSENGVYLDAPDREKLQDEMTQLCEEISRIAQSTKFHGIHLFQNVGYNVEKLENAYWGIPFPPGSCPDLVEIEDGRDVALEANPPECPYAPKSQTLLERLAGATQPGELNIIYSAMTYDFDAYPVPGTGGETDGSFDGITDTSGNNIKTILQEQIVPNTVQNILTRFPALGYLKNSSIGIGLRLYSDASDTAMASVTSTVGDFDGIRDFQEFTLSINMAHVDLSTAAGRSELERAVVNEMVRAFMDEALTAGMTTPGEQFPSWFVEGMAAAAGGAGSWVSMGLDLTKANLASLNPTDLANKVQTALSGHSLENAETDAVACYGAGYLACMYLGYLANGGGSVSANGIAAGLNQILGDMIGGRDGSDGISLESVLQKYTGDPTMDINKFEREFANAPNLPQFVKNLVTAADNGAGSVLTGNLQANDLVSDTPPTTKLHLFELNTEFETIKNIYPSNVHVSSGGTATQPGTSPTPLGPYPGSLFQVNGSNADAAANCNFDETWGVLNIESGGTFKISGGKIANPGGLADFLGRIVIADNVGNVTLELDGVDIDLADSVYAALDLGKGNNVTIKITGSTDNVFRGGYGGAGIQVGEGSSLTIEDDGGDGTLTAIGGSKGAGIGTGAGFELSDDLYEVGNITIRSGKITAMGGQGAAGIGAGCGNNIKVGDITVQSGNIAAQGGTGAAGIGAGTGKHIVVGDITVQSGDITAQGGQGAAGIGAGSGVDTVVGDITIEDGTITAEAGWGGAGIGGGDATGNHSNVVGDIVINGGIVKAHSPVHGAGIGSGWVGTVGNITITGGKIDASSDMHGAGIGAGCGASGGNILISGGDVNAVGGEYGAGIGTGMSGEAENIEINGGIVRATAGENGAGIGAGMNGTVKDIYVRNGEITAKAGNIGTGIGAGERGLVDGNIYISGGKVKAAGGNAGAGIGASRDGRTGNIEIRGGEIIATSGADGAGVGAGRMGETGNIFIAGGTITARSLTAGAGIGAGILGKVKDITICGGVIVAQSGNNGVGIGTGLCATGGDIYLLAGIITALGGMPDDIYNIGSFKDKEHEEAAKLVIGRGTTIMGGWHGEGRYNTTGAVDRVDPSKQVFAFPIPRNGKKIVSVFSEGAESGERFQWQDLDHYYPCGERDKKNAAYIWMYGENQTLDINYADGTSERLELYFDEAPGIWRKVERTKQPDCGGIILQVGAERGQILVVPRFYFSAAALELWKFDISTQQKADETMSYIGDAIGRVSEMRGYYGALQNRLEHIVNNLANTTENLTAAESRIRDADIAQEMYGFARVNVMDQAAQAMMAHANMRPQQVLELLK